MRYIIKDGKLENAFGKEKKLVLPDNITRIGGSAFKGCPYLEEIVLNDMIRTQDMDNYWFHGLVVIPETWTHKGEKIDHNFLFYGVSAVKYKDMIIKIDSDYSDDSTLFRELIEMILSEKEITAEYLMQAKNQKNISSVFLSLCRNGKTDCLAYVKKRFSMFAKDAIDRECMDELKEFEGYGFFTKSNTGKLVEYAFEKGCKEIIYYLLKIKDSKGGFKIDEIDKYLELAKEDTELTALLLNYKNKYFTSSQIEQIETDRMDKELGFKERTAAEWKKIFGYEINDGEITITSYKGSDTDIIIPETICGKPVTAIGNMAFSPIKPRTSPKTKDVLLKIKSVYIGENIKKVGVSAFNGCTSLESLTIVDKTFNPSQFGSYKNKPIKWSVLNIDLQNKRVLIISEQIIDKIAYNNDGVDITWENCSLRKWLNEELYAGFSDDEKKIIADTEVVNRDGYGDAFFKKFNITVTKGGNNTIDKIFILDADDVGKYFLDPKSRFGLGFTRERFESTWLWVRCPGRYQKYAVYIKTDGSFCEYGQNVSYPTGIRPALNIKF